MSQQRQFEGSDIRALLDEIRSAYGTEPTIAKAETVRSGGVMGFFQKEHYRLLVEGEPPQGQAPEADTIEIEAAAGRGDGPASRIPVGRPPGRHYAGSRKKPAAPAAPSPAYSALSAPLRASVPSPTLLASVPSPTLLAERTAPPAPPAPAAPAARFAAADHFSSLVEETEDSFVPSSLTALAPPTPAPVRSTPAPAPYRAPAPAAYRAPAPASAPGRAAAVERPAAETPSFESVLRRVADLVDGPAAVPMMWPSVEELEPLPPVPAAPAAPEPLPAAAGPRPAPAPELLPEPLVARLSAALTEADAPLPTAHAPLPATDAPNPGADFQLLTADTPDYDRTAADAEDADEPVWVFDERPATADTEADLEEVAAEPVPVLGVAQTERRLALHRVGFDPESIERIEDAAAGQDLEMAILEFFDGLPAPARIPDRNGSLIVVAGPAGRAATEAGRIAGEIGADPGGVVHARQDRSPEMPAESVIHSVEDAQEIAPGLRRGRVGVVAVESTVGTAGAAWARRVIHALRPTYVVGVIDAMHKTEDVDAWVEALGGIDDLVVDNIDSTVSPARVLELDVPVSRLGQHPATAARWAATVLDRVAPDAAAGAGDCRGRLPGQA